MCCGSISQTRPNPEAREHHRPSDDPWPNPNPGWSPLLSLLCCGVPFLLLLAALGLGGLARQLGWGGVLGAVGVLSLVIVGVVYSRRQAIRETR